MSIRLAAALLVGAFGVFLVGAGFWLLDEFEQPLAIRLRAVANRHVRWMSRGWSWARSSAWPP